MHIWKTDCSSKQGSAYRPERRVRHEPEGGATATDWREQSFSALFQILGSCDVVPFW